MSIATMALPTTGGSGRDGKRDSNGAVRAAGVVTNLIKLGGLVLAMKEGLSEPELRPIVIGLAGFMMAGAQAVDSLLTSIFNPPPPPR